MATFNLPAHHLASGERLRCPDQHEAGLCAATGTAGALLQETSSVRAEAVKPTVSQCPGGAGVRTHLQAQPVSKFDLAPKSVWHTRCRFRACCRKLRPSWSLRTHSHEFSRYGKSRGVVAGGTEVDNMLESRQAPTEAYQRAGADEKPCRRCEQPLGDSQATARGRRLAREHTWRGPSMLLSTHCGLQLGSQSRRARRRRSPSQVMGPRRSQRLPRILFHLPIRFL
mmetsp:Transcript_158492/g.508441  ORF Transcript_158492/g.508441 Transcript_158492/m.508441 type:complete len:226 (+) Transcript_158492:1914-2591(+)